LTKRRLHIEEITPREIAQVSLFHEEEITKDLRPLSG